MADISAGPLGLIIVVGCVGAIDGYSAALKGWS